MKKSQRRGPMTLAQAMKSFQGFLEGTGKAAHTIRSYHHDLQDFARFAQKKGEALEIARISRKDLERYHETLKADGQRANTRRRKLMTLRKMMEYLNRRSKTEENVAKKFAAPEKIERIPHTFDVEAFLARIRELSVETPLDRRNRCLFWLMAETGISVSEVSRLRWSALSAKNRSLEVLDKSERRVPLSKGLLQALAEYRGGVAKSAQADDGAPIFTGWNRFGSLGGAMSPRGIELLVKSYAERLDLKDFTPRNFRHSAAVHWFREGAAPAEIQKRLGLKTDYSMRMYAPIFARISEGRAAAV